MKGFFQLDRRVTISAIKYNWAIIKVDISGLFRYHLDSLMLTFSITAVNF